MKPENSRGRLILELNAADIGVSVANSDIPFVLKIEIIPNTTCWPPKTIIFMSLSVEEKEQWCNGKKNSILFYIIFIYSFNLV